MAIPINDKLEQFRTLDQIKIYCDLWNNVSEIMVTYENIKNEFSNVYNLTTLNDILTEDLCSTLEPEDIELLRKYHESAKNQIRELIKDLSEY